ncbi:MAG: hypothetical protein BJBARM5_0237 [Candidatus Parvarchaeum acidophilus ARMAN-5]|jgi:hypothetical protein|uniref:YrhK domain-containing protein n=1 Tax=Candidatus Parvarchaeum acidophilus ARMAN-5 TaxID=662762 RepID=D6GUU0_PARA5|nr:MAG: conserved hypothetical protein [Candidatus Parvarchaeum acidophilus ARMAN-5]
MEYKRELKYKEKYILKKKIERNYKILGLLNDFMIGFEFLTGSFEFLPGNSTVIGVYLFIAGSAQILIVPIIKIARDIHIKLRKLEEKL